MRRIIFGFILVGIAVSAVAQMLWQPSAESDALFAAGVDLYKEGKFREAIPLFAKSDSLDKAQIDPTSNRRDYSSMWLASCYYKMGDTITASKYSFYFNTIPIDRRLTSVSDSIAVSAINLLMLGNYEEAYPLLRTCVDIESKICGPAHPFILNTLSMCQMCSEQLNDSAGCISYTKKMAETIRHMYGKYSQEYLSSIDDVISKCEKYDLNNKQDLLDLLYEKLSVIDSLGIKGRQQDVCLHITLNAVYRSQQMPYSDSQRSVLCRAVQAVSGLSAADTLKENLENTLYGYIDNSYYKESKIKDSEGNYETAINLMEQSLVLRERLSGKNSLDYAISLGEIATYYGNSGEHLKAVELLQDALHKIHLAVGEKDVNYLSGLNNLAIQYSNIGNYNKAIKIMEELLPLRKSVSGINDDYISGLSNLSLFFKQSGNYEKAIKLGQDAVNYAGQTYGVSNAKYAVCLQNLANYHMNIANFAKAIVLLEDALKTFKHIGKSDSPEYYTILENLSLCNAYIGNYEEALNIEKQVFNFRREHLSEKHPDYCSALRNIAKYYYYMTDYVNVTDCIIKATQLMEIDIRSNFSGMTSSERALYWDMNAGWLNEWIPKMSYYIGFDSINIVNYNVALFSKGILLNTDIEMSKLIAESGDSVLIAMYGNLRANRLSLAKLYEKPVSERTINTDSLERLVEAQEKELVKQSKIFGDYTNNLFVEWTDVRDKLGQGDIAVEFISFPAENDSIMYVALTLKQGYSVPKMVPLFEERQLASIDKRLYLSSPMLYNLVWKPLEKEMAGVKTVYFAPSGELYNLPIENLPVDEGTYNSGIRGYRRLSSTRQLALRRDGVEVARAAVYGGLKYDTDTVTLANDSRKYRMAEPVQWSSRAVADSLNLRDGVYELPATKIEAEEIDKALETAQIDTRLYTDTIGTEASFKAMSGSGVNALHIATHGFYWTEREAARLDGLAFLSDDMPAAVKEDKALTRSGLLFAGANTALKGLPLPDGVEDGVLTAKEIAGMDLRGLDLVALSACQTGLGEITGDGVFGLQRGFKKAGANTLLMSLWKVDDTATQLLMTQFYKNLLSGMGKYEALAVAQKYLRELEVEVKITPGKTNYQKLKDKRDGKQEEVKYKTVRKYAHPKYWAAFVLLDGVN